LSLSTYAMSVTTPELIPPPYFEHQRLKHCTMHACNNALGRRMVTLSAMNRMANRMAAEAAARSRAQQLASAAKDPTGSMRVHTLRQLERLHLQYLTGPQGNWSPDVAFRVLQEHGIYAHTSSYKNSFPAGQWVILGEVLYPDPHDASMAGESYAHSVAVCDGWFMDSEHDGPMKLPSDGSLPPSFSPIASPPTRLPLRVIRTP
jgi:hypothetical protein